MPQRAQQSCFLEGCLASPWHLTAILKLPYVFAAICANMVIFAAKLVTFLYSGSSAMLAETVHSVVDTFNQVNSCSLHFTLCASKLKNLGRKLLPHFPPCFITI